MVAKTDMKRAEGSDGLSRRNFLKSTAAGTTLAVGAVAMPVTAEPVRTRPGSDANDSLETVLRCCGSELGDVRKSG